MDPQPLSVLAPSLGLMSSWALALRADGGDGVRRELMGLGDGINLLTIVSHGIGDVLRPRQPMAT